MPSLLQHQSNEVTIEAIEDRFGVHINEAPNGCWLWCGPRTNNGYPRIGCVYIHREVYTIAKGEIPQGLLICHKCCTKLCVNPNHLYAGTHKQNKSDPDMQKVYRRVRKLDAQDYEAICILHSWGWPKTQIAKIFKVHNVLIGKFLRGELKHAKPS